MVHVLIQLNRKLGEPNNEDMPSNNEHCPQSYRWWGTAETFVD